MGSMSRSGSPAPLPNRAAFLRLHPSAQPNLASGRALPYTSRAPDRSGAAGASNTRQAPNHPTHGGKMAKLKVVALPPPRNRAGMLPGKDAWGGAGPQRRSIQTQPAPPGGHLAEGKGPGSSLVLCRHRALSTPSGLRGRQHLPTPPARRRFSFKVPPPIRHCRA